MKNIAYPLYKSPSLSLPREILIQLNSTDINILDTLISMCRAQVSKSPTGAAYAFPGQTWLGSKIDRARENVSRSVSKLKKLGLIEVIHRRKIRNMFQTNLYRAGHALLFILKQTKAALAALLDHVTKPSHIVNNSHSKETEKDSIRSLSIKMKSEDLPNIIKRLANKMGF